MQFVNEHFVLRSRIPTLAVAFKFNTKHCRVCSPPLPLFFSLSHCGCVTELDKSTHEDGDGHPAAECGADRGVQGLRFPWHACAVFTHTVVVLGQGKLLIYFCEDDEKQTKNHIHNLDNLQLSLEVGISPSSFLLPLLRADAQ